MQYFTTSILFSKEEKEEKGHYEKIDRKVT
jgi:hypothetical protein